jgi:ABC-type glutathione transport system ATPase component
MEEIQRQVKTGGMSLVLVTHDEELAKRSSDRVLKMQDGLVVPNGTGTVQ